MTMLKNYLKVALRSLRKQVGYTAINVGGLGLGLACCFLIVLFIQHELSFDRFHENGDRIVRLTYTTETEDDVFANSAAGYAPLISANVPEVAAAVRVENFRNPYVDIGDGTVRQLGTLTLADAAFFQTFSFPLRRGNPATVLDDKYALVLTESTARDLFGDADPMGRTVRYSDRFDLTVAGIMADVPENSHIQFDAVSPFALLTEFGGPDALDDFSNYNFDTYLLLHDDTAQDGLAAKITGVVRARFDADNEPGDDASTYTAGLQPLSDIRFNTTLQYNRFPVRDPSYLWIFGAIGLLILLIACVNFTNLATARAAKRAQEVGVRKAIGAQRGQLIGQFLGESVLLSLIAVGVGIGLAVLALPLFNEAVGGAARYTPGQIGTGLLLVAIGLGAGVLAGSYPAFYLAAFKPAQVLKGEVSHSGGAPLLRKGLIVFQFAISVFLIVATLTVYNQLGFMQGQDLGFTKEQVVFFNPPGAVLDQYDTFRDQLLADPDIQHVAFTASVPGRIGTNRGYNWPGQSQDGEEQGDSFWSAFADPDYLEVFDVELVAGRMFSHAVATDTNDTYLLNETAVAKLGWTPEEAVGQPFRAWDRPMGEVIGVVKDFHFQSLHHDVQPLVLNYKPDWMGTVAVRMAPGEVTATLDHIQATWDAFALGFPLEYRFLDEDFDRLYRSEVRLGKLFGFFASIAIFIACLGLFGLAAFTAQQRTKEIGVRKVLGASAQSLVVLLSKDFVRLVGVALVVATPVAYVVMTRWLSDFAYRVELGAGTFLLAGALALGIALLTVAVQAFRAATTDPIRALRYE